MKKLCIICISLLDTCKSNLYVYRNPGFNLLSISQDGDIKESRLVDRFIRVNSALCLLEVGCIFFAVFFNLPDCKLCLVRNLRVIGIGYSDGIVSTLTGQSFRLLVLRRGSHRECAADFVDILLIVLFYKNDLCFTVLGLFCCPVCFFNSLFFSLLKINLCSCQIKGEKSFDISSFRCQPACFVIRNLVLLDGIRDKGENQILAGIFAVFVDLLCLNGRRDILVALLLVRGPAAFNGFRAEIFVVLAAGPGGGEAVLIFVDSLDLLVAQLQACGQSAACRRIGFVESTCRNLIGEVDANEVFRSEDGIRANLLPVVDRIGSNGLIFVCIFYMVKIEVCLACEDFVEVKGVERGNPELGSCFFR